VPDSKPFLILKRTHLLADEKEHLVDRILSLEEENEKLREENGSLQQVIEKLKKLPPEKPEKEPFDKKTKKQGKPPSQWGRKEGHPGCTRHKPDHIDREVEQTLRSCPTCKHHLGKSMESIEHIQEDIIPARVEVTRYRRHRYWCSHCRGIVTAPYGPDEVPNGYVGPRTLLSMVLLKYYHALPGNKIRDIFQDFCGLTISEGAISHALQRLACYLKIETDTIKEAIRKARVKHADETGWTINGINYWLWAFINNRWAYFDIQKSRGSKVVHEVLGSPFSGVLISDFYNAYNRIKGKKQKCLVHLRREMRHCLGNDPPEDFLIPYRRLKRLLQDALRLGKNRTSLPPLVFQRRRLKIRQRLFDFATATYSNKNWQRLSKRLLKHERELITFLDVPALPTDNNPAERQIRPHVIVRNRSYQNRTPKGAEAHSVLTSLIHTLRLQHKDVMPELQSAYLHHRQKLPGRVLFN
jgi:transposase